MTYPHPDVTYPHPDVPEPGDPLSPGDHVTVHLGDGRTHRRHVAATVRDGHGGGTVTLDDPQRRWPHLEPLKGCVVAPWTVPGPDTAVMGGDMAAHAVARVREWENPQHALFVDWEARCGAYGTRSGSLTLGTAGLDQRPGVPRRMLCRGCWS